MITVRSGQASDVERVNDYYESRRRSRAAKPEDIIVLAEDDNRVIGAVRLCTEEGHLVLRGMDIEASYRRQGLGRRMLEELVQYIGDQDCYSLPWKHLDHFYGIIGFQVVEDDQLPEFLQERLASSRKTMLDAEMQRLMQADLGVYSEDGITFTGMMRPGT